MILLERTARMQHFEFFIGTFLVLSMVGTAVVVAGTGMAPAYRDLLAAPIIGACVLSIGVTVLYRFGVPPYLTALSATVISAVAIAGHVARFRDTYRAAGPARYGPDMAVRMMSCGAVMGLILLPHYLGGPQFAIFQGSRQDTFNYLSGAVGFANYSYAHLSSFDAASEPIAGLAAASYMLTARPAVALLYAALYKLFSSDFLINAYDYCLVGQLTCYFAFLYLMLNCFPGRERMLHVAAVAFGTGFFTQYVLDINSWSEIFAVPMMVLLLTDFCRGLLMVQPPGDGGPGRAALRSKELPDRPVPRSAKLVFLLVRLPLAAAGVVYVYPEILPLAGLACAGAFTCVVTGNIRAGQFSAARRALLMTMGFAAIALALVGGYWNGTMGFLMSQLQMATSSDVEWHRFFQAYLFGGTTEVSDRLQSASTPAYLFYVAIAAPANFLAGFLGLYFLQPRDLWIKPLNAFFLVWPPILLLWLIGVSRGIVVSIRRELQSWRSGSGNRLFGPIAIGALAAFAVPAGLLLDGKYWAAGKGLSMLTPFVFAALVVPIVGGRIEKNAAVLCSMVLGAHLCFGFYRPIIVASRGDGGYYNYPYPTLQKEIRNGVDWDLSRHEAEIGKCSLVKVDVADLFFERIVENYLMDKMIRWFSPNPQFVYYGEGLELPMMRAPDGMREDCTIATEFKPDESKLDPVGQKIILLNAKP